jgi:hypothetical protein
MMLRTDEAAEAASRQLGRGLAASALRILPLFTRVKALEEPNSDE